MRGKFIDGAIAFVKDIFSLRREDPRLISLFDRSSLLFLLVTAIWYSWAYHGSPNTPSIDPHGNPGWWGWFDQGEYYKSTIALAHGELKPSLYWIGYPLLGVPVYYVMPRHPYFIPELIMVMIMAGSFFASCRHYMGKAEAWMLAILCIFMEKVLRNECLIEPWNTMPLYATAYLAAYLLIFSQPTLRSFIIVALATGVTLLARPGEIIPLAPLYLFGLFNPPGIRHKLFAVVALGVATGLAATLLISLNFHLFGQFSSPYMQGEGTKFSLANFGIKAYQFLVDGTFLTGNALLLPDPRPYQVIERFPYLLLVLPGVIYLWKKQGLAVLGFFLAIVFSVSFYLTYCPFICIPHCWTYGCFHYVWWTTPWIGFLAYLSLRQAPFVLSRRLYVTALLIPPLLLCIVGFSAKEVAASDAKENPLKTTASWDGQVYKVTVTLPADVGAAEDIRITFQTPPPYPGTSSDTTPKVRVSLNNQDQADYAQYKISQEGSHYDFSFLSQGLFLKKGDHIVVTFAQAPDTQLARVSLRHVQFSPGQGIVNIFTR